MIIIVAIDRPSVPLISQLSSTKCGIETKTQTLIFCSSPWLYSRQMNDTRWKLKFLDGTTSQPEDLLVASLSQCSFLLRLCSLTLCLLPHHQYLGIFIALQGFLHWSGWSLASWHSIKSYTVKMTTTCWDSAYIPQLSITILSAGTVGNIVTSPL